MRILMIRLFSALIFLLLSIAPVCGFGGGGSPSAAGSETPVVTGKMKALTIAVRKEGTNELLQVPLFSEKYAQLPVAKVNDEPITLKKFSLELASMHTGMAEKETPGRQSFTTLLDRLITIKLIKQEALNIGFDRTPAVQSQIETFALTTMIKQLLAGQLEELKVDMTEVDELYQQMAIEARLLAYKVFAQADAETLLAGARSGGDFKQLADRLVAAQKAEGGEALEYARLNDLLPAVAQAAYGLKKGEVSEIFKEGNNFMLFRLEDKRVFEDPVIRQVAADKIFQQQANKKQLEYLNSLEKTYATYDLEAEEALDFARIAKESPEAKGSEVLARLGKDQRPVVTMTNGQETVVFTVADIAKKLESTLYHGADKIIEPKILDKEKGTVIRNKVVAVTGRMAAQAQEIDKSEVYLEKLQAFEDQVLFDTFIAKAVVPGITVPEEDAKRYYYNHLEDFSSPLMLKMKSLVYAEEQQAREALSKLQSGSDFKWVSANVTGLADPDNRAILSFDDSLLSVTALPEDLHELVEEARQGDLFLYAGPENLYYVLLVETAYEPKAKLYADVRQEAGQIIYARKIDEALKEWVRKLKEAYETKIFIVDEKI
ncbi:MAG: peptidyl-prolyl cis-trans isomerase [Desulfuromonadales bacterium]|nr:peptidyl-prolyl cis-trans isomerase [Desulfuromonadales bacterium]